MNASVLITKTAREIKTFISEYFDFSENFPADYQAITEGEKESISMLILEEVFGLKRIDVALNKSISFDIKTWTYLIDILNKMPSNEPIQYILGHTEFYGMTFRVSKDVLIPRPETEELVDFIIKKHQNQPKNIISTNILNTTLNILDIGTGSGCIIISLAKNLANSISSVNAFAMDISENALKVAESNAKENNVKVQFIQQDILAKNLEKELENNFDFFDKLDIVVSNPPYVTQAEKQLMQANVLDFEPHNALFVEDLEPLVFYERIIFLATKYLKKGGFLYFEINEKYPNEMKNLLEKYNFSDVEILLDLQGKSRMIFGQK